MSDSSGEEGHDEGRPPAPARRAPRDEETESMSCEQSINHIGMGSAQVFLVFAIGLLWTADSMEILLLSFIGPGVQCEWNLRAVDQSVLTTVVFVGMLFGSMLWGKVGDLYGRKVASIGTASLSFGFGLACAFARSFFELACLRCAVGLAVGGVPIAFSYMMEFIPAQHRGPLAILFCTFWSFGAIFEAALAWAVMSQGYGWRWLVGLSSAPMALSGALLLFVPESPHFLLAVGRKRECELQLSRLAQQNDRELPLPVADLATNQDTGRWSDLLAPGIRTFTLKQWFIWGCSGFAYYGVVLLTTQLFSLEDQGMRCNYRVRAEGEEGGCHTLSNDTYGDVFLAASGELPGLLVTAYLVQRIGRRTPMSLGCVVEALCCALLVPCLGRAFENSALFLLRAVSASVFQVVYLYTGEAYPPSVKGIALGTCSSMARIGGMVTPYVANALMALSTELGLLVYAATMVVCALVVLALPFDTRGCPIPETLEQLQARVSRSTVKGWVSRVVSGGQTALRDDVDANNTSRELS